MNKHSRSVMGTNETLQSCRSLCRHSRLSPEKVGETPQIRFFFSGGRRLRHRLSCSYSHELATSSSGSSSSSHLYKCMFSFFCKETFKWWHNLWSLVEGNFERKFYCLAFEKKYYRKDFVIKLAWLNNRKLPKELLRPISVKHSEGFQLPLSNRKQERVLTSTPNILIRTLEWLRVATVFLDPYFHLFRQSAADVVRVTVWLIFFSFSDFIKKLELLEIRGKKAFWSTDCFQKTWQTKNSNFTIFNEI